MQLCLCLLSHLFNHLYGFERINLFSHLSPSSITIGGTRGRNICSVMENEIFIALFGRHTQSVLSVSPQTQKQTLWQTLAPMCQTCIRNLILTFSVINVPLCIFFFFNQDLINAFGNILINCKIVFITLCRIIMPVPR